MTDLLQAATQASVLATYVWIDQPILLEMLQHCSQHAGRGIQALCKVIQFQGAAFADLVQESEEHRYNPIQAAR